MSISRRAVLATAAAALPAVTLLGSVHDAVAAPGTTYYIAEEGDDQATGTSESTPWQSVNKVVAAINAGQIVRGDTIVFKRGQTFYGQFTDLSGLQGEGRITFGAYGSGEKPRIMGYKVLNKPEAWRNIGGNQWQIELVEGNYSGNTLTDDANVGFLLLDSAFHGRRKFPDEAKLEGDLEFYSVARGEAGKTLTVYSKENPSSRGDLRVAVDGKIFQAVSNMTIQDLDLIGCGGHGIQVRDVSGVEVLRNRIRHIGGSHLLDNDESSIKHWRYTRILVAELGGVGPRYPLSREKLTSVIGWLVEDGWRAGCERAIELLKFGGDGHSIVIHSRDEESILAFGIEKPAFRILVNTWGCLGGVGYTTGLRPSFTLGPGGIGGAAVSDNITVEHVLNIKRVAYHLNQAPEVARAHGGRLDGVETEAAEETPPAASPVAAPVASGATDAALIEKVVRQILTELHK